MKGSGTVAIAHKTLVDFVARNDKVSMFPAKGVKILRSGVVDIDDAKFRCYAVVGLLGIPRTPRIKSLTVGRGPLGTKAVTPKMRVPMSCCAIL